MTMLPISTDDIMHVARLPDCSPSKVRRYTGKLKPQCNGGVGCFACWKKWSEHRLLTKKEIAEKSRKAFDRAMRGKLSSRHARAGEPA